jgi:hypothetical protein
MIPARRWCAFLPTFTMAARFQRSGWRLTSVGHVLQDAKDYRFMRIRQSLVGPANFGTSMAYIALAAGLMLKLAGLIWLGVIGFGAVVLFQLVTLPVEFDASARARKHLLQLGIVRQNEDAHVGRVLNAAAWTYVAALISSLLTLAYFIIRAVGASRDDEMYSADLMNRSQTRPEIGEGGFETGSWAFRCRHPLFPLVRGVRREHLAHAGTDLLTQRTSLACALGRTEPASFAKIDHQADG